MKLKNVFVSELNLGKTKLKKLKKNKNIKLSLVVEFFLLNDDMRGREKNSQCCNNSEQSENKETNTIYHHCGKLPVSNKIVFVFFLFQFCSNESELTNDSLEITLSLINNK